MPLSLAVEADFFTGMMLIGKKNQITQQRTREAGHSPQWRILFIVCLQKGTVVDELHIAVVWCLRAFKVIINFIIPDRLSVIGGG